MKKAAPGVVGRTCDDCANYAPLAEPVLERTSRGWRVVAPPGHLLKKRVWGWAEDEKTADCNFEVVSGADE